MTPPREPPTAAVKTRGAGASPPPPKHAASGRASATDAGIPDREMKEGAPGENARLRALVRHQEAIAEISRRVLRGMDPDLLLSECAALVARTLEIEVCVVLEFLPKDGRFLVRAACGLPDGAERLTLSDSTWSLAGRALRAGGPFVAGPFAADGPGVEEEETFGLRVHHALLVTIGGRDEQIPFGVLAAYATRGREGFSHDDALFIQFIADTAAAAIERVRQETALRLGEARYQRIVAHTPGMVYQFRLRPDGTFSFPFVTEGCRELFGVEPQAIYDDPLTVIGILHEADRDTLFPAILASARSLAPFCWTGRYVTRAGETRWMRADSRPEAQANGDMIWDGLMFDIHELKQTQEAMQAAKEEAEKANRAKSEFLSRISHELRTPLNAILGFSQFLRRQQPEDGVAHDCLGHIAKAGTHLLSLINEVLDISRVEAGQVELAPVPTAVGTTVEEAFALVRGQAEERGITLRLERAPQARRLLALADPQRLKQILHNLLSNAVKYNCNGGGVRVACMREGGAVEISITDDGPGIPADKLGRLFVAFDRLGAEATSVPGTGLGLVLTKSLVEALGGSILVGSESGQGATFRVRLPAAPHAPAKQRKDPARRPVEEKPAPTPAPTPTPPPVRPRRVLYIEDNSSNRFLLERLLDGHPGITLLLAATAAEGLRILRGQPPPDLLLLDLHLPDMPGEKILRLVRQAPDARTRRLPVIVMSADATAASIERILAAGANAYLTKPLDLPTLLGTLERNLKTPETGVPGGARD